MKRSLSWVILAFVFAALLSFPAMANPWKSSIQGCDGEKDVSLKIFADHDLPVWLVFMDGKDGLASCKAQKKRLQERNRFPVRACACGLHSEEQSNQDELGHPANYYVNKLRLECYDLGENRSQSKVDVQPTDTFTNDTAGWNRCEAVKHSYETQADAEKSKAPNACDCEKSSDGQSITCADGVFVRRAQPITDVHNKVGSSPVESSGASPAKSGPARN